MPISMRNTKNAKCIVFYVKWIGKNISNVLDIQRMSKAYIKTKNETRLETRLVIILGSDKISRFPYNIT